MARAGYNGEVYTLLADTPTKQTGLTDVEFGVFNVADGTPVTGSPFSATEIGTTGVYKADWTPTAIGDYLIEVSSVVAGVSEISGTVNVLENSNDDLATAIEAVPDATEINVEVDTAIADATLATSAEVAGVEAKVDALAGGSSFRLIN